MVHFSIRSDCMQYDIKTYFLTRDIYDHNQHSTIDNNFWSNLQTWKIDLNLTLNSKDSYTYIWCIINKFISWLVRHRILKKGVQILVRYSYEFNIKCVWYRVIETTRRDDLNLIWDNACSPTIRKHWTSMKT